MSCLFISCINSANRSPILQEGSAVQAQHKTIIIVIILSYCSLQMFRSSGASVRLTLFLSSVAYFICTVLHWVMAVPLAILQEYPPYLPRAETNEEPAVLLFLFLFQGCTSLHAWTWALRRQHVRCKLALPGRGKLQQLWEASCLEKLKSQNHRNTEL